MHWAQWPTLGVSKVRPLIFYALRIKNLIYILCVLTKSKEKQYFMKFIVSVNKILLEHGHNHCFVYFTHGCFHTTTCELSTCNRCPLWTTKMKIIKIQSFAEKVYQAFIPYSEQKFEAHALPKHLSEKQEVQNIKKPVWAVTCHQQKLEHLAMCFQKFTARRVSPGLVFPVSLEQQQRCLRCKFSGSTQTYTIRHPGVEAQQTLL